MSFNEELFSDCWCGPRKKPPPGIKLLLWHTEEEEYYLGSYDEDKKLFKIDVRMREEGRKTAYLPRNEVRWFDFPAPPSVAA